MDKLDPGLKSLFGELCDAWQNQNPRLRTPFQGRWLGKTLVVKHPNLKNELNLNSFDFQLLVEEALIRIGDKEISIIGIFESLVPTAQPMSVHRRDPELDRTQLVVEEEHILSQMNGAWEKVKEAFIVQIPTGNHVFTIEQSGLANGKLSIAWAHFGALKRLSFLSDRWSNGSPRLGAISITASGREWYANHRKLYPSPLVESSPPLETKSHPKVFISHSSLDKARFVEPFARRLRQNGIDAWLDQWEMLPGDSLIEKIFNEGLDDADAVIMVISSSSIESRWVKQELDVAAVRRIQDRMPIIPILIDDCEIPSVLTATVWEHIKDLDNYDQSFERIMARILGRSIKPPLGPLPTYALSSLPEISGLSKTDTQVLKIAGNLFLVSEFGEIYTERILEETQRLAIPDEEVLDSLSILADDHYIENLGVYQPIDVFQFKHFGVLQYSIAFIDGFDDKMQAIASVIVNEIANNEETIAKHLSLPQPFVAFAMEQLKQMGLLKLIAAIGMPLTVLTITPRLKRFATSQQS